MLAGIAEKRPGLGGLARLAEKIEGERALKLDMIASTEAMEMVLDEDKVPTLAVRDHGAFPVLKHAHGQIGERLGIPAKYYERMRTEDPALLTANVNAWFWTKPEKRMVRTLGGDARAYLSNGYQRIDHHEVAEVALPVLAEVPDLQVVSCEITDRRMYVQVTAPRIRGEVKRGDVVQAGVIISNSEIGEGAISVAAVYWRLLCLNGAVAMDKYSARHAGRRIEDDEALWADDTRRADDKAILLKVRDMVRAALDETRFAGAISKMQGLAGMELSGDPVRAVKVLAERVGTTEAESGSILKALIKGGDLSAWGLVNAVTAQAHDAVDYDRAVEFERAGGALIALPDSEWRRVLIGA